MSLQAVPSLEKKARASQEIQQEFNNVAYRCGHIQHDIFLKEKDLKMCNETLMALQVEFTATKQQEELAAKAAAAKAAEEAKAAAEAAATPVAEAAPAAATEESKA